MRGLHARFSDVHAHSFILETFGMFCALYGMLHYSVSSTPCVDLMSTRSIEQYVDPTMSEIDSEKNFGTRQIVFRFVDMLQSLS